jgi:sterol desaturase/sphingolipid hydroxylase (fatty acid hydroxylase superfamily)
MVLIYLLLVIIAIGVLLLSPQGRTALLVSRNLIYWVVLSAIAIGVAALIFSTIWWVVTLDSTRELYESVIGPILGAAIITTILGFVGKETYGYWRHQRAHFWVVAVLLVIIIGAWIIYPLFIAGK